MAKLRLIHFLSVVIAMCLLQSIASASISVTILSPANGTQVNPGDTVYVQARFECFDGFLSDAAWYTGTSFTPFGTYNWGYSMTSIDTQGKNYTIPSNATPGSIIIFEVDAFQLFSTASGTGIVSVTVAGPDTTAPTYSGTAGIKSVERVDGANAAIEWYQASDNVTSAANMRYRIYYDTVQANVFTAGAKKTVTGGTTTSITGLTATSTYYIGVRAVDEAGNAETNTRTLFLDLPLNAVHPDAWAMYR